MGIHITGFAYAWSFRLELSSAQPKYIKESLRFQIWVIFAYSLACTHSMARETINKVSLADECVLQYPVCSHMADTLFLCCRAPVAHSETIGHGDPMLFQSSSMGRCARLPS